ncbi:MAG TPA: ATPase, partial [Cyanothece sp. UBA12306]|nr:ATPase [Cyanothece sp. UBA12306]
IALADSYPVIGFSENYYNKIANLIDEETQEIRLKSIFRETEQRWPIIESLKFPPLNAAAKPQELENLFQKTADFNKFLDPTTCLIRGRKGTGKTALYDLLLKHTETANKLANGRLDNVLLLSGHGAFKPSRPTRNDFEFIQQKLIENNGNWEAFWRAYLLLNGYQKEYFTFPNNRNQKEKFLELQEIFSKISHNNWISDNNKYLIQLATDENLRQIIPDALVLFNEKNKEKNQTIWFLYDDLDEDFPEKKEIRKEALTGLFQLIQFCDARSLKTICFKVLLREDIWKRLNFDNKSHFNGRDLVLQWTRVDFLRLALRQVIQSKKFKDLLDRTSPVEDIDQASEENLNKALDLLWGSRRRKGDKAKYVSRWIYERLTDSSGTTFPRSLSVLLQRAKEKELTYKNTQIQPPTDRFLRSKSLEIGLEEASNERCNAIKQEYPDLCNFFDALEGINALLEKDELEKLWKETASEIIEKFDDFTNLLATIGLAKQRDKDQRYGFADLYVYGFKMSRKGTK